MNKLKPFAPVVLRIGLSLVFLWFAFDQFMNPNSYIAFIPQSILDMTHVSASLIIHLNALFEIVFGTALLLGFYTRTAALLLALHLFDITYVVGFGGLGVRDFGLSMGTLAVFMYGRDFLSLDRYVAGSVSSGLSAQPSPSMVSPVSSSGASDVGLGCV